MQLANLSGTLISASAKAKTSTQLEQVKADHHLQQHQRQAWERLKWGDILQICNENKVNGTGEKGHMLKKDVLIGKLIARHIAVPHNDSAVAWVEFSQSTIPDTMK